MIIRSQDKESIINMDNISHIYIANPLGELHDFHICASGYVIAEYSTEEKAIKVLDMICEYYQECKMCESGRRQIAQVEFVFQMPQDSEV